MAAGIRLAKSSKKNEEANLRQKIEAIVRLRRDKTMKRYLSRKYLCKQSFLIELVI